MTAAEKSYCSQCGQHVSPGGTGHSTCESHHPQLGMIQAGGPTLLAALRAARQALVDSYNAVPCPGDDSIQPEAISAIDSAIQAVTGKDADGLFVTELATPAMVRNVIPVLDNKAALASVLPASMLGIMAPSTPPSHPMARAVRCIAQQFAIDEHQVTPDMHLPSYADSLDMVELVMAMEDEFDIELSDEDVMPIKTVAGVFEALRNKGVEL